MLIIGKLLTCSVDLQFAEIDSYFAAAQQLSSTQSIRPKLFVVRSLRRRDASRWYRNACGKCDGLPVDSYRSLPADCPLSWDRRTADRTAPSPSLLSLTVVSSQ